MAIRPKSKELLQAQLVSYVRDEVPDHRDRAQLLTAVDQIAGAELTDGVNYTTEPVYSILDGSEIHPAYQRTAGNIDDYTDYIRRTRGGRDIAASEREELLRNFAQYEPAVTTLASEIDEFGLIRGGHPSFLGQGLTAMAFTLEYDDQKVVARIPSEDSVDPSDVDHRARAAILAREIPGMERILAISYETGVVISEFMPGVGLDKITCEEMSKIDESHLEQFIFTCTLASQKGITIDSKESNIFFDTKLGFGIIDFQFKEGGTVFSPIDVVVESITKAGKVSQPRSQDGVDEIIKIAKAKIHILDLLSSMENGSGGEKHFTLDPSHIRKLAEHQLAIIDKYSDNEQAKEEIRSTLALDEQIEKARNSGTAAPTVHIESDVL